MIASLRKLLHDNSLDSACKLHATRSHEGEETISKTGVTKFHSDETSVKSFLAKFHAWLRPVSKKWNSRDINFYANCYADACESFPDVFSFFSGTFVQFARSVSPTVVDREIKCFLNEQKRGRRDSSKYETWRELREKMHSRERYFPSNSQPWEKLQPLVSFLPLPAGNSRNSVWIFLEGNVNCPNNWNCSRNLDISLPDLNDLKLRRNDSKNNGTPNFKEFDRRSFRISTTFPPSARCEITFKNAREREKERNKLCWNWGLG